MRGLRVVIHKQALYSRQVRELEQFFGVELTRRKGKESRSRRRVENSPKMQLRVHLQRSDRFQESLCRSDHRIPDRIRQQHRGMASGSKMGKLATEVPSARFSLQNMRTADIVKGLKEHSVDFRILRRSAVVAPLKFHSMGQIGYALFAPTTWARRRRTPPVAMPRSVCRRRVQQTLSRVLRKSETDSKSSIQLRQLHPGCRTGAHRQCSRAATRNG